MEINVHEKSAQVESVRQSQMLIAADKQDFAKRHIHLEVCGNSLYKFESSEDDHMKWIDQANLYPKSQRYKKYENSEIVKT